MGQWYVVALRIKPLKGKMEKLCEAIESHVRNNGYDAIRIDLIKRDANAEERLKEMLDILYPGLEVLKERDGDFFFESSFDGSYSRETAVCNAFCEMAPYLRSGSYMTVWPDSGHYTLKVRNGQVA